MLIGRITDCTRVVGEGQGYIGLPIRDIRINCTVNGPNTPAMETAWLPTPKEMRAIEEGRSVYVRVIGTTHPPIMVYVGDIPEQPPVLLPNGMHKPTLVAAMAACVNAGKAAAMNRTFMMNGEFFGTIYDSVKALMEKPMADIESETKTAGR